MKLKEFIEDTLWNIKAFLAQPIIPTVTIVFVMDNDGEWICDSKDGQYSYYWIGDDKTGYQVRVKKNTENLRRWARWNLVN